MPKDRDNVEKKQGRRPRGTGGITELKDGRFRGKYPIDGKDYYVYAKTRADCNRKLLAAIKAAKKPIAPLTLGRYIERWLNDKKKLNYAANSYKQRDLTITNHIVPVFGSQQMSKISSDDVQAWISDLAASGYAPNAIKSYYSVLSCAFKDAVISKVIPASPCVGITLPSVKKVEKTVLTMEQFHLLLQELEKTSLHTIIVLAATTGMREGELLALRWDEVDFTRNVVFVRRNLARIPGEFVVGEPKSEASNRTLPLMPFARKILLAHRSKQNDQIIKWRNQGKIWEDNNLVFPNKRGCFRHGSNIVAFYKVILRRVGLPDGKFHDWRYFFASYLGYLGVSATVAKELLGHASIDETLNIYTQAVPGAHEEAIQLFNQTLSNALVKQEEDKKREAK